MNAASPQLAVRRPCILVVEDEPEVRELVTRAFRHDYEVYEAQDGAAALAMLERMPRPDLVLTDVAMPRVGGVELAKRLKAGALKDVPIVFLTARDGFMEVVDGINAGARQYLTKPFRMADLRARVAGILAKR